MKKIMMRFRAASAALLVAAIAAWTPGAVAGNREIPAKSQAGPVALVGGTVHTVSGESIPNGTVLFENGKIVAVGANVTIPPGAETIRIEGKHVYPGLILAASQIGLVEIGAVRATRDITETGTINPNIRPEVAVNPESEIIPVTRANGITVAVTMPAGGVISGSAAAIELDGWTWEDMVLRAPVGMVVNWPNMTVSTAWWETRSEEDQLKERDERIENLRKAFREARAYMTAAASDNGKKTKRHDTDLRWDAMIPVLEGKVPVFVNADNILQIEAAVAWADQEKVKLVILGGYDAPAAAPMLKARDIPVIAGPIHRTPSRRWEAYDAPFTLPMRLKEAGIRYCIAADGGYENERNLPYHAAAAASYGLPREEALKAITLYPAQILGIADRVGSIEAGKDATLIVTNGDPLEITGSVEMEFIRGKSIPLSSRHTHFYDKYKEKYERLNAK